MPDQHTNPAAGHGTDASPDARPDMKLPAGAAPGTQVDPDQPEQLIELLIWSCPSLFPSRTEVLEHLFFSGGNGMAWDRAGRLVDLFAEPDKVHDLRNPGLEADFDRRAGSDVMADVTAGQRAEYQADLARLEGIRRDYRRLARTSNPVTASSTYPHRLDTGLAARAPENITAAWETVRAEATALFTAAWSEQATVENDRWAALDGDAAHHAARIGHPHLDAAYQRQKVSRTEYLALRGQLARHAAPPATVADVDDAAAEQARTRALLASLWNRAAQDGDPGDGPAPAATGNEGSGEDEAVGRPLAEVLAAVVENSWPNHERDRRRPVPNLTGTDWAWFAGHATAALDD